MAVATVVVVVVEITEPTKSAIGASSLSSVVQEEVLLSVLAKSFPTL